MYLVSLDLLPEVQLIWTVSAIILMIVLRLILLKTATTSFEPLNFIRLLVMLLAGMITLRYMWWRTFHSIPLDGDIYSLVCGILLYLAEIQATVIFFLGAFLYMSPLKRDPDPISVSDTNLPSVDVLVPTYNESVELLRVTLLACTNLRYPSEKLNIYLLDDGGTEQHRNDPDPTKAQAANLRHQAFKSLCRELGVQYLTRKRNNHAKAGNINAALEKVKGDLVLILDCDHVPTIDFLENTVAPFLKDEKLWLVQTPHFLINNDPIEKNIGTSHDMPSENELFYTSTLRGMDNWNAAFFCGSGALIRRKYLDELGGICTETVTEDIETSIEMHKRGYNSIYLHRPMLAGLQPESFSGFIIQRLRWTHGMLQVFMMKNPLVVRGLTIWQRLCYVNMTGYWFFSYMRLAFLLSPVVYLLFGVQLYDAPVEEIMIYGIPHLLAFVLYSNVFFGRFRWFLVSEVYETLLSIFAIRTVIQVILHPERGHFVVTPKDEKIDNDFVTPLATVYYPLIIIMGLALCMGGYNMFTLEGIGVYMNMAVTFWALLNFLVVLGSLGALQEKRQQRSTTRFDVDMDASLLIQDKTIPVNISDLSANGLSMSVNAHEHFDLQRSVKVKLFCKPLGQEIEVSAVICSKYFPESDTQVLGVSFQPKSVEEEKEIIALTYGDGDRWRDILKGRNIHPGLLEGLKYFMYACVPIGLKHLKWHISSSYLDIKNKKRTFQS